MKGRITAPVAELIDAHQQEPAPGSHVQALTVGGILVSAVWKSDSLRYFDAWAPFPKIPDSVKKRQLGRMQ